MRTETHIAQNLQIALKEWAVVQRALLDGRQIIMVRKGGIIEESGDFDLRSRQFLLQPTYAHETERLGDVQPQYAQLLADEESRRPAMDSLRFEAACEVVDVVRAQHADALIEIADKHIWSDQFLRGRFAWEPYKPVFVLIVRTYALPHPVDIPWQAQYGGCKSWSDLAKGVWTDGAVPAIGEGAEFQREADNIRLSLTRR